jgi:K+-sensing histidine kinase KdpD
MNPELFLHLSFLFLVISSLMRTILPLRALAIASGIVAIVYSLEVGKFTIVIWEFLFTAVNLVQAGILLYNKSQARLMDDEVSRHQSLFGQLNKSDFQKLINAGNLVMADKGEMLARQGEPVIRIILITNGAASVEVNDKVIAYCRSGDFVGEMAFISGSPASASVRAIVPTKYLMWRIADLKKLLESEPDIKTTLLSVFNRNLIDKLLRGDMAEPKEIS